MRRIAGILGILAVLAGLPAPADAGWVPGQIAVQGDLENLAGEPIPGPVHLIFALYPSLTAQEPVWWEIHSQVPLVQGSFDLLLGEVSPLDDPPLFEFHSELWVGVTVNGAPELPRVPLVSVGYSFQAAHAATADALSQPAGDLECPGCVGTGDLADGGVGFPDLAATGCVGGEVLKRNTGNTGWECLPDADSDSGGDITAVSAGAGLLGGGDGGALTLSANPAYLQRRVTPGCAAGSAIRSVAEDGSTTCEADNDLLAELSCPDGMIPRRSAGVWGCALPILEAEVDAAVANNGYASQASLAAVATSGSFLDLVDVPPDLADGDDTGLTGSGTAGSFARFGPSGSLVGSAMSQDASNRVGIGTATPSVRLDVTGEVRVGNSGTPCDATTEGSIRYVAATKTFEGCDGSSWKPLSWFDATPDPFDFTDVTGAGLAAVVTSNIVKLTGFTKNLLTLVTGEGTPQMRVCANATCSSVLLDWTTGPVTLAPDQHLQLRLTAATTGNTQRTATVTVGDVSDSWKVTTSAASWRIGTWNGAPVYGVQTCPSGDYYCQAKSACEQATGATCVWQSYTCSGYPNQNGSFYPTSNPLGRSVSTSGSSNLNWTVTSGCAETGDPCTHGSGSVYGNLCCCNCNSVNQQWNEGNQYCGVGIWEPY